MSSNKPVKLRNSLGSRKTRNGINDENYFTPDIGKQMLDREEFSLLVMSAGPILKGYLESSLEFVIDIDTRRADGNGYHFTAIFQFPGIHNNLDSGPSGISEFLKLPICTLGDHKLQQPVLVNFIERPKHGQQAHWPLRSTVWLKASNLGNNEIADSMQSATIDLPPESFGRITDRKHQALNVAWSEAGISSGNHIDQVVECRPQIMEAISSHERPSLRRKRNDSIENDAMAGAIACSLLGESIRVLMKPAANFTFDGLQVLIRPIDLGGTTAKTRPEIQLHTHENCAVEIKLNSGGVVTLIPFDFSESVIITV